MINNATTAKRNLAYKGFGALVLALGIAQPALAATLTCTVGDTAPAAVSCVGSGWTPSTLVGITASESETCDYQNTFATATTDESGQITGLDGSPVVDVGTWYLFGSEDACLTSTADAASPHDVAAPVADVCGDAMCTGLESASSCLQDCGIGLISEAEAQQINADIKATGRNLWPIYALGFIVAVAVGILYVAREAIVATIITPFGKK